MSKLYIRGSKEPVEITEEEAKEIIHQIKKINRNDGNPIISTNNISIRAKALRAVVIK